MISKIIATAIAKAGDDDEYIFDYTEPANAVQQALTEAGYAIVPVCQHFSKDPMLYDVTAHFESEQKMDDFFEALKTSVCNTPKTGSE